MTAMTAEKPQTLIGDLQDAVLATDTLLADASRAVRARVVADGRVSPQKLEREQRAAHGLAWLATYAAVIRQLAAYAERLTGEGRFGEIEHLMVTIGAGEYLAQIAGGIAMSQGEIVRLADLGVAAPDFVSGPVAALVDAGNTAENRARLAELIHARAGSATVEDTGLDDMLDAIREEMRKFSDAEVRPHAHEWHLQNAYIPMAVIEKMAELGVFGLTIPEEFGGMGLGKESMCVVSEELSCGYIGVGSLGTRSEIAAELILGGGTDAQKEEWLPKIASGEILPTAVFTEPNTGSDLASLKTRAVKDGDVYKITGNKTWITHPVRADLMTVLARTNPDEPGYRGLSMFLAPKPRGTDADPFPAKGMTGGEIEV
ncbi:MAG: acyl-CoA/acyl-ACP dehydrogenase, partial [Rhodobiaceae bacterium]|nr:acyl-CoA/acyl-ACP dehydrogenase [Rhodobiaceae bacterium]